MSGSVDLLANAITDLRRLADAFGKLRSHSLRNRELISEVSGDQMHLAQAFNALAQEIAELRVQVGELRQWRDGNQQIDADQQNRFEGCDRAVADLAARVRLVEIDATRALTASARILNALQPLLGALPLLQRWTDAIGVIKALSEPKAAAWVSDETRELIEQK